MTQKISRVLHPCDSTPRTCQTDAGGDVGCTGESTVLHKIITGTATAFAVLVLASFAACAKSERPPLAELSPSMSPAPPSPMFPIENDQAQGELAAIGAIQTVRGWTLPITNAKFEAGRLSLEQGDRTIDRVATALKQRPHLRVLIEAPVDQESSIRGGRLISQMHADEVLRALTAKGVEAAQIQAQGRANARSEVPGDPGVILIFSNPMGEFASAARAL